MEELVRFDPHLVVGILGGSAGTTRDAFQLLHDAKKYGGRVALFGRKINNAENQLAFVNFLRLIADGQLEPEEGVRAYHAVLQRLQIPPHRPLEADLQITDGSMSYAGTTTISVPNPSAAASPPTPSTSPPAAATPIPPAASPPSSSRAGTTPPASSPDFARMTPAERLAYHQQRLNRLLGQG
jgi:hypothetical protein